MIAAGFLTLAVILWALPGAYREGIARAVRGTVLRPVLALQQGTVEREARFNDPSRLRAERDSLAAYLVGHVAASVLRRSPALTRVGLSAVDRELTRALVAYVAVGAIIGNVAVHADRSHSPARWPGAWRQLEQISRMPFRTITLKVADQPDGVATALAMYYIPARKAHVFGRGVPLQSLDLENVSRHHPMFIQNFGCEGVGHGDIVSVPQVGCVLMAPPSMMLGASYPLNRAFLFLEFDRISTHDPGGRWNAGPTLNLRMTADPERLRLDRHMFINLLVNPFLPAGVQPQRLIVRWGKEQRGAAIVGERQWFSVPVASNDWSGNRLWSVRVAIDFPDGRPILFHEVALTESPRGQVVQPIQAVRP